MWCWTSENLIKNARILQDMTELSIDPRAQEVLNMYLPQHGKSVEWLERKGFKQTGGSKFAPGDLRGHSLPYSAEMLCGGMIFHLYMNGSLEAELTIQDTKGAHPDSLLVKHADPAKELAQKLEGMVDEFTEKVSRKFIAPANVAYELARQELKDAMPAVTRLQEESHYQRNKREDAIKSAPKAFAAIKYAMFPLTLSTSGGTAEDAFNCLLLAYKRLAGSPAERIGSYA